MTLLSYTADDALKDWAAGYINVEEGHSPDDKITAADIAGVDFEGWIGCYSSWTCEYGVTATIRLTNDRASVETEATWHHVLEGIEEYLTVYDAMLDDHARSHDRDGDE